MPLITIVVLLSSFISPDMYINNLRSITQDIDCMSKTIYYEARNQPLEGQTAIGFVILNRVHSNKYPNDICSVVHQKNQFSWFWDNKSDVPKNKNAYLESIILSCGIMSGVVKNNVPNDLFYHADYVTPKWAENKKVDKAIGNHYFYE